MPQDPGVCTQGKATPDRDNAGVKRLGQPAATARLLLQAKVEGSTTSSQRL
jgi:hypothetical protein